MPGAQSTTVLFAHSGVAREFIHALKFRRERSIGSWLAAALAANVPADIGLVTWPPTTTERRRQRGFDQAELLARRLARHLRVSARRLLARTTNSSQSGLGRQQRLTGPSFEAVAAVSQPCAALERSPDRNAILVVDDVLTTGATLRSAVAALRLGIPSESSLPIHAAACTSAPKNLTGA